MNDGKSFVKMENSGSRWTGKIWQIPFAWLNHVPIGLFGFHFPSEVIKKLRPSTWKTPARINSWRESLAFKFFGTKTQYFTLPHMFRRNPPDSLDSSGLDRIPEMSHIVTWWFRRSPLESAGIKENKVDCSPEKGVRWSPPESTGLEWELIPYLIL